LLQDTTKPAKVVVGGVKYKIREKSDNLLQPEEKEVYFKVPTKE
jgi:hypothetical protein